MYFLRFLELLNQNWYLHYFDEDEAESFVEVYVLRGANEFSLADRYIDQYGADPREEWLNLSHELDDPRWRRFLCRCFKLAGFREIEKVYMKRPLRIAPTYRWIESDQKWRACTPQNDGRMSA